MIADKDFNLSSSNDSIRLLNRLQAVKTITMHRSVWSGLNANGYLPIAISMRSMTHRVRLASAQEVYRFNKPAVIVEVSFYKRVGRIGLVYENNPTVIELDGEEVLKEVIKWEKPLSRGLHKGVGRYTYVPTYVLYDF